MKRRISIILTLSKIFIDGVMVYLSFVLAYWLRFHSALIPVNKGLPPVGRYLHAMPIVILIFLASYNWNKLFVDHKITYKTDELINIIRAVLIAIVIITAATFIYREYEYSRLVLGFASIFSIILTFLTHLLLRLLKGKFFVPSSGKMGILVIGGQKIKDTLLKNISKHHEFNVVYSKDIDISSIVRTIKENNVLEIVHADLNADRQEVLKLINICEQMDIDFKMAPDMLELKMGEMRFDHYFGIPVLELKHPLFEPANYYLKRVMDIIISMTILLVLAPFIVLLMLAIKLDTRGPIIYSHLRKGYKGKNFPFFKFRSMVLDADEKLKQVMKYNERSGPVFKMKYDPRVTRIGRIIRKYSLDEMPQLFNVLRGDMSLVGPRPQVLWEAANYDIEARRRLNVLPGITGLWQVSGRSELSYEEMIKLDLYYLENWTPGLDFKILFRTLPVVILKKGAY
ncbi:sugar transferase [Elusimicrobiota bacterium]